MTCRACLFAATVLCTRTMTMSTGHVFAHLELFSDTLVDFLKRQTNFQSEVTAPVLLRTATAAPEPSEAMTTEYVTEHGEDVVHIH